MWRLANQTLNYTWGSTHAIPGFLGQSPSSDPVAEMWVGTHHIAPSSVTDTGELLSEAIASDPVATLGQAVHRDYGELPFLVKLLAADTPLSLQVHPKSDAAQAGYERENKAGIALTDPTRTYKDPHAKPEILLALTETTTLVGFRDPQQTRDLLGSIDHDWARRLTDHIGPGQCMVGALDYLTTAEVWDEAKDEILAIAASRDDHPAFGLMCELDRHFPGDPGAAAPLLMNIATYQPGEVLYTGDALIHAHVKGFGIEVMTSSDNVIRAGLTTKHIDRQALLANVDSVPGPPTFLHRTGEFDAFVPPVSEFAATIRVPGERCPGGPRILLSLDEGTVVETTHSLTLHRGETAFVPDGDGPLHVRAGSVLVAFVP